MSTPGINPWTGPGWNNLQMRPPPATAQSWTYGQHPHAPGNVLPGWGPPHTPGDSWGAPTPAASWGMHTPANSWGPLTPASAGYRSPWDQPQTAPAGFSATAAPPQLGSSDQPMMASSWFGAGAGARAMNHEMNEEGYYSGFSHERPDSFGHPLKRSLSHGHAQSPRLWLPSGNHKYHASHLAGRPKEWREGYSPRGGPGIMGDLSLSSLFTKKRIIHPFIAYNPHAPPPVLYDLRYPIQSLEFPILNRPPMTPDLSQVATDPPTTHMRLFHHRLPWFIDVEPSHPSAITIFDVLIALHEQLMEQIKGKDFWNRALDDTDRERINRAFKMRCRLAGMMSEEMREKGVRRVDYLGKAAVFVGLVRRGGDWEIMTTTRQ